MGLVAVGPVQGCRAGASPLELGFYQQGSLAYYRRTLHRAPAGEGWTGPPGPPMGLHFADPNSWDQTGAGRILCAA